MYGWIRREIFLSSNLLFVLLQIVKLLDVVSDGSYIALVLEYMSTDLLSVVRNRLEPSTLPMSAVSCGCCYTASLAVTSTTFSIET